MSEYEDILLKQEKGQDSSCKSCSKEPVTRINVKRFILSLDECFKKNDLQKVKKVVTFWEKEAIALDDKSGLITILNEELGLYRNLKDEDNGLITASRVLSLLKENNFGESFSIATIYVNLATTLKAFNHLQEAITNYDKAENIFNKLNAKNTFEYASLLNNKSATLIELKEYNTAEDCLRFAIEILKNLNAYDVEVALSFVSLAHLYYENGNEDKIDDMLDTAWEYINSPRQKRDENYAFVLSKCVPSYSFFKRDLEAKALKETIDEIYNKG